MSRNLKLFIGFMVVAGALGASALGRWAFGPGPGGEYPLRVREGASLREIAHLLTAEGVVRSPLAFELVGRLKGAERKIRAGPFTVPPAATPAKIVDLLVHGRMDLNEVTVPEGLTIWETASILWNQAEVDSVRFVEAATDSLVAHALGVPQSNLEGYLFPDTYDIPPATAADEVLITLVSRAEEVLAEVLAGRAPPAELAADRSKMVILASIVEAEARLPEERPRIAAVYLNRLRRGMRLEADPTVAYALRTRRPLLYRDLEVDSPWNTYRVTGLPPTAIGSPGQGSLEAVILAANDSSGSYGDELYFVARGDGGHIFSRTFAQHEKARHEVRRRAARSSTNSVPGGGDGGRAGRGGP